MLGAAQVPLVKAAAVGRSVGRSVALRTVQGVNLREIVWRQSSKLLYVSGPDRGVASLLAQGGLEERLFSSSLQLMGLAFEEHT